MRRRRHHLDRRPNRLVHTGQSSTLKDLSCRQLTPAHIGHLVLPACPARPYAVSASRVSRLTHGTRTADEDGAESVVRRPSLHSEPEMDAHEGETVDRPVNILRAAAHGPCANVPRTWWLYPNRLGKADWKEQGAITSHHTFVVLLLSLLPYIGSLAGMNSLTACPFCHLSTSAVLIKFADRGLGRRGMRSLQAGQFNASQDSHSADT